MAEYRSGFAGLIGRPNVGKSTLLNRLIGQKISITTPKPQTTRHRILGIKTLPDAQILYVDTPGIHKGKKALNRYLLRVAMGTLEEVDVVVFMVEGTRFTPEDEMILERLKGLEKPVILAINKVDKIKDKRELLPFIDRMSKAMDFAAIVPISATRGTNLDVLEAHIKEHLPPSPPLYPEEQITDRSQRFLAAEIIRERLMILLRQELPYALTVEIERFEREDRLCRIGAIIWVERPGHKGIVIGKKGEMLKKVGQEAREAMEQLFDCKVFLELWVKVKEGWSEDERILRRMGYDEA